MVQQGFIVLFRSAKDRPLQACPVLAPDDIRAREKFLASPAGAAARVVEVLSLADLERHRRAILSLAVGAGQGIEVRAGRQD